MPQKNDNAWIQACSSFLIYLGSDMTSLGKLLTKRKYGKVENCVNQLKHGCNTALFTSQNIAVSSSMEAAKMEWEGVLNSLIELADEAQLCAVEMTKGERRKAAVHINNTKIMMESINKRLPNIRALVGK